MVSCREQNRKLEGGFTLIEVMIAVAILAVMSVLIYTSVSQTIASKDDTEKKDEINHSAALAMTKMASDLEMAFLLNGPDFLGSQGFMKTVFTGTEEKMNFPSLSHTRYFKDSPEADFGEVGYFLEDDKEEQGNKILMRRESKKVDEKPEEGGVSDPLLDHVKSIHFEFYDAQKKDWVKSWDSSQLETANRLPRAVKIEIQVMDKESEEPLRYSTIAEVKLYDKAINF